MAVLGEIFYWVLNMSIIGSYVGVCVLLLRRIRALPRFGVYLLWALPLIRLWVPVGFANQYNPLNYISRYAVKTVTVWERQDIIPEMSMSNSVRAATEYFPIEYKTDLLKSIFETAGFVWIVAASVAVLCSILLYVFTKSAIRDAEHIIGNIYRSDKVLTSAIYGIFKPRIIIPINIADSDLDYIIAHEQVHIRRKDNLWRVVAIITACVHWFNPLTWVFLKYFFADMEFSCDTSVLRKLSPHDKKSYALALLNCSDFGKSSCYASSFGGANTRMRIENILSYRKLTVLSAIYFTIFLTIVAVTLITNTVGG